MKLHLIYTTHNQELFTLVVCIVTFELSASIQFYNPFFSHILSYWYCTKFHIIFLYLVENCSYLYFWNLVLMICLFSRIWLFDTLWFITLQAPLSMGFSRQRILEWVAMPSTRRSSQLRDQTCVSYISCIGRWVLYHYHHLESPKSSFRSFILIELSISNG